MLLGRWYTLLRSDVSNIKDELKEIRGVQMNMLHKIRVTKQLRQQHLDCQSHYWQRQDESRQQQINAQNYLAESILAMVNNQFQNNQ